MNFKRFFEWSMKKSDIKVVQRVLLGIIAIGIAGMAYIHVNTIVLLVKDEYIRVEVAKSEAERTRGLSGRRTKLNILGEGMLFVFDGEAERPMWMKNTHIPLDIIWLDSDGRALFIVESAKPWPTGEPPAINPPVKAKYVLELFGGRVAEMKLEIGDMVEIFL